MIDEHPARAGMDLPCRAANGRWAGLAAGCAGGAGSADAM